MEKLWFKARDYGWGWYPTTWQGWLVIASWIAWLLLWAAVGDAEGHPTRWTVGLFLSVLVLLRICWKRGERPSWRWAGKPASWQSVVAKIIGVIALAAGISALLVRLLQ